MNNRGLVAVLLSILGFLHLGGAQAATLNLLPSSNNVFENDSFGVDLVISGLGADEVIRGYAVDILFDDSVLTPTGVTFGSLLGGPSNSFANFDLLSDEVQVEEFTLLPYQDFTLPDLFTPQITDNPTPRSVFLASIEFLAIATGMSAIDTRVFEIFGETDEGGLGLISPADATIQVEVSPVPLPGAIWLMLTGLVGVGAMARRCKLGDAYSATT